MQDPGPDTDPMTESSCFRAAFDALPHATAVLDAHGVIVAVNASWHRFAEENGGRTDVTGHGAGLGVDYLAVCAAASGTDAEDGARVAAGIRHLLAGRPVRVELEYPCHSPQARRWYMMTAHQLPAPARGVVVTHVDITRRKLGEIEREATESALQATEARYRGVVEDQTECICRLTSAGVILYVNPAYCRFFGGRADDLIGNRWQPLAHPDDVPMIEARLAEMAPENPVINIENRVFAANGDLRRMHFVNRGFYDESGGLVEIQSVGRDVTQRVRAEEKLRLMLVENMRLGRELIRLQEAERARLARELHDDLSQQLVAIRAYAGAIRRNPADAPRSVSNASAIEAAVADIYVASHRIMEGLHPQVLDSAGLHAAISLLLTRWSLAQPDIRAWLRTAGDIEPADDARRINLFRIVQECLANVQSHSGATRVRLFLGECPGPTGRRLRLVVRDDGRGMDLSARHPGYGLIVMRERVRALGGRIEWQGRPGGGLRVALDVPLDGAIED